MLSHLIQLLDSRRPRPRLANAVAAAFRSSDGGQGGVEYSLIVGGIALALLMTAATAFSPVGTAIAGTPDAVAAALGGGPAEEGEEAPPLVSQAPPPPPGSSSASMPASRDDCKKGGWASYGFSSQGTCVSWYNENS